MNRKQLKRKRDKAIQILRDTGMSDAEIEAELGYPITDDEPERLGSQNDPQQVVDAEIVDETPNLPAVIQSAWNPSDMENQKRERREYPPKPGRTPDGRSTNNYNVAQYNQSLESNAERRCVATNAKGERCRRYAIQGSTVCKTHGGSTRYIVNKARIRVEMASNRLMGKLIETAFDDTKPAAVQLDAIKDSLNRAGLKPREQVEVGPIKPHEEIFEDIISGSRAESRRARGIEDEIATHTTSLDESIAGQSESADSFADTGSPPPAPVAPDSHAEGSSRGVGDETSHSDCDRPAATHSRERQRRDRQDRSAVVITGEDAIRLANQANMSRDDWADERGLPRGRSR